MGGMDYVNLIVTHPFLLLWAGQLLHMLKEVKQIEERVPGITAKAYVTRHKYGVMFSTVAGLVVYAILFQTGELSPISAFMAGYMSDSMINAAASRANKNAEPPQDNDNEPKGDEYYDWYASRTESKDRS